MSERPDSSADLASRRACGSRERWLLTLACAALLASAPAAEDDKAEVVPLPDETPTEPHVSPKPPPKEPPREQPKETVKEPPKEPAKTPPKEAVKETPKEAPKERPKPPPKETVKVPPEEQPERPTKEPAKAAGGAEPPVVKPPVVKPPAAVKPPVAAPAETGENTGEPPAETVPLPAEKPDTPANGAAAKAGTPERPEDQEALMLTTDKPTVLPGQTAVFGLYGPETYLRGATARYVLRDEFGRQLARGTVKVSDIPFSEGQPRQLKAEVKNPLAQQYVFEVALTGADGKQAQLERSFTVPKAQTWEHWIALAAVPPGDAAAYAALRSLGIRGGMQYRLHPARREALRKGGAPFYVESIGRQLLSRYHTERGLWEKTVAAMRADSGNRAALTREPSLCSQAFAEAFARELKRHVDVYAKDPPLFYSLASEPSVTRLAAAADFDFSPAAIQEFQRWLERDVYGTLQALNTSWETQFAAWTEVVPMTTGEARLRLTDGVMSFGPWADFRAFQDYSFAKVLRDGAEFIRQQDPTAKVGITGALGPFAFGGWDWSRLAQSLDVVEAYDIGGARSLWRDLAPGKPALAALTLSGVDTQAVAADAARAIWSLALEGGPRGVLLWDEEPRAPSRAGAQAGEAPATPRATLLDADGKPTPLAKALAPTLRALDGDLGPLLANSSRLHDGIGVLYSPASVRLHWLFEAHRLHGDKWLEAWGADTGAERRESPQLRLRESWCKLLDDLGLGWRFVSSAQVESKEILRPEARLKTIVLPRVVALSDREAAALKQFVQDGGQLVADAACGRFDEHGRLREKPALDDVFQIDTSSEPFVPLPMNPLERLRPEPGAQFPAWLAAENVPHLAPVFSDRPKWAGPHKAGLEYRRSPVLAANRSGSVYLNLDLTDYLRWRLHPDQPRAQVARQVLAGAAFAARRLESAVDWGKTRLPLGTQVVWLSPRGAAQALVLALRRNPQARLYELGSDADGNWPLEKTEPFALALRTPAFVEPLAQSAAPNATPPIPPLSRGGDGGGATALLEGTLSPVTPAQFLVSSSAPQPPRLLVPSVARLNEVLEINVAGAVRAAPASALPNPQPQAPNLKPQACLFSVRLFAPDGSERPYHSLTKFAADGALLHAVPLALNEPPGTWRIVVRDAYNGGAAEAQVQVTGAHE